MTGSNISWRTFVRQLVLTSFVAHVLLAGWHGGAMVAMRANGAVATITVCAGGVLHDIAVDADGVPVPGDAPHLATTCPFCAVLASGDVALTPDVDAARSPSALWHRVKHDPFGFALDRRPLIRHGQDPPFFS